MLDVTGHSAGVFYVLLMYSGQYDFLPELYEVLGQDQTIQLLDIFAGVTIKFPAEKVLERLAAEVTIYLRIKQASSRKRPEVIKDLADQYLLDEDIIRTIYDKTSAIIEDKLGMEVLLGASKLRRYRKKDLKYFESVLNTPLKVEFQTYFYFLTLPFYILSRLLSKTDKSLSKEIKESNPPAILNSLIKLILKFEGVLLKRFPLPAGSSLFAVLKKH